jgi:hypothetical protein
MRRLILTFAMIVALVLVGNFALAQKPAQASCVTQPVTSTVTQWIVPSNDVSASTTLWQGFDCKYYSQVTICTDGRSFGPFQAWASVYDHTAGQGYTDVFFPSATVGVNACSLTYQSSSHAPYHSRDIIWGYGGASGYPYVFTPGIVAP